jgi:hypothetical protein
MCSLTRSGRAVSRSPRRRRDRAPDPLRPATSVALPAETTTLQPTPAAPARRYRLSLALRELARRREPVRVELVDGGQIDGTIEAVGSDYLEIAEHEPGEARRRRAVKARRFLGLAAVAAVTLPPARR